MKIQKVTDANRDENIQKITEHLFKGVVHVNFIKKDGTTRYMRCTLVKDSIPEEQHPKSWSSTEPKEQEKKPVVTVYDLDKKEWRSFRKDSVVSWRA